MTGFRESLTGTGEGSGRRWRGADGPGGGGGMFAGSEGPERAVAGRYERRQTGQVPCELFWQFFTSLQISILRSPARRRRARMEERGGARRRWGSERQRPVPMGERASAPGAEGERVPAPGADGERAGTDVAGTAPAEPGVGGAPRSFLDTTYSGRTHAPLKAALSQTPGYHRRSATTCRNVPCLPGVQTSDSMGWHCRRSKRTDLGRTGRTPRG